MNKIDLNTVKNGIICFTFDDRNFDGWIEAIPLFERYNAHAGFFVCGDIDSEAINAMKALKGAGHTVGLHGLDHLDAPEYFETYGAEDYFIKQIKPQLDKCKKAEININCFAYPNNKRSESTDAYLMKHFKRLRCGRRDATEQQIYIPINDLSENKIMRSFGIGKYYNTVESELLQLIQKTADTNTCVTFVSHKIFPNADFINMPTELLEKCLERANELGVKVLGFDEI